MPLQLHPITLGCMLVVAVGTMIYTYYATRQREQEHSYGGNRSRPHNVFEEPPSRTISRASSNSSLTVNNRLRNHRRLKPDNCDDCVICRDPLESALKTLTCQHVFHSKCITVWLNENKSCPLCREAVYI